MYFFFYWRHIAIKFCVCYQKTGQRKSFQGTAQFYVVTPEEIDTTLPMLSIRHIQYETDGLTCFGRKVFGSSF